MVVLYGTTSVLLYDFNNRCKTARQSTSPISLSYMHTKQLRTSMCFFFLLYINVIICCYGTTSVLLYDFNNRCKTARQSTSDISLSYMHTKQLSTSMCFFFLLYINIIICCYVSVSLDIFCTNFPSFS